MKTKEEIFCKHLGEYVPCELKNVVLTYVETRTILAAVQEYADQEKAALKEKLKEKVKTSKLPGFNKALVYAIITEL